MVTPKHDNLPSSWQALLVWAIGRFGVGVAFAAVFAHLSYVFYTDMRAERAEWLATLKRQSELIERIAHTVGLHEETKNNH